MVFIAQGFHRLGDRFGGHVLRVLPSARNRRKLASGRPQDGCGRRRHRQANSVRVLTDVKARRFACPRSAGLTALTSAPRHARLDWLLPTMPTHTPYMLPRGALRAGGRAAASSAGVGADAGRAGQVSHRYTSRPRLLRFIARRMFMSIGTGCRMISSKKSSSLTARSRAPVSSPPTRFAAVETAPCLTGLSRTVSSSTRGSDEPWVVDGAAVRVSPDLLRNAASRARRPSERQRRHPRINADLTAAVADLTRAQKDWLPTVELPSSAISKPVPSMSRTSKPGEWLRLPTNPNGRTNADVLKTVDQRHGPDPPLRWQLDCRFWLVYVGNLRLRLYEEPFRWGPGTRVSHARPTTAAPLTASSGGDTPSRDQACGGRSASCLGTLRPRLSPSTGCSHGLTPVFALIIS